MSKFRLPVTIEVENISDADPATVRYDAGRILHALECATNDGTIVTHAWVGDLVEIPPRPELDVDADHCEACGAPDDGTQSYCECGEPLIDPKYMPADVVAPANAR